MRFWAIVSAAGTGERFGAAIPKQYATLLDKPVIAHTLTTLASYPRLEQILVVVNQGDPYWPSLQTKLPVARLKTVYGGATRLHSVYQGLLALQQLAQPDDWVLVHDAVRPCLEHSDIDRLMTTLQHHPVGGLLGARVRDTLKYVDENGSVMHTLSREGIWEAHTPQMFRYGLLMQALQTAIQEERSITDEAGAIELSGQQPLMVEGSRDNIKITYPEDLQRAARYLQQRH